MAADPALQNFLVELENGDPIEHYRPRRSHETWKGKLVVPQCVTRIYQGLWGDLRTMQPLLGSPLRMDVTPKTRKLHWADTWNVYPEHAVYDSTPPLRGRRPSKGIWCALIMYVFKNEEDRPSFWVNPMETAWDFDTRTDTSYGQTFYVSHRPLPVTTAFVRIDQMHGTMRHRGIDAREALVSLLNDLTPSDEWRPPAREEKPPPPTMGRLPSRYLQV